MARIDPDFGWGATMKIADSGAVTYNEYYGAATETMKEKNSTLDKLTNETFFKIVMGESPLDEFDKYVSKWKTLGGDDITKEVNEWYKKNK
jgi:putative aldouronate transport system substrate-binding protein